LRDKSFVVTASAQGALAWYATEIVGRAAEHYLLHGKSWGDQAPSAQSPISLQIWIAIRSCARRAGRYW
jgi:hypothetical protein